MNAQALRVGLFRGPERFRILSLDRYAENLGAALAGLPQDAPELQHIAPPSSRVVSTAMTVPGLSRAARHVGRFPEYMLHARGGHFDINHVLDHAYGHLVYVLDRRRTVVTCHDTFPLKVWRGEIPGLSRRLSPPLSVMLSLAGTARAAAVIVPSETTKRELVTRFGVASDRIFVVRHGVDHRFSAATAGAGPDPLEGRRGCHVLVVDTGVPYKNQRATTEVLARVATRASQEVTLVRVGSILGKTERERAAELGVTERILELGVVSNEILAALYARCDVLFFPSFYEGFGWPVLEAMAAGTPVVCSTWETLLDLAGDAALTAPADDYEGLAAHVLTVLENEVRARSLVEAGRRRVAEFTWARAARDTAAVYASVAEAAERVIPRPSARVRS